MPPRFVADSMLGRLAKWLRALGFDVFFDASRDDHAVIAEARARGAVVLTRDTRFPKPPDVRVVQVRSDHVQEQLAQLVGELSLTLADVSALTRCTVCNEPLVAASRGEVWPHVPPFIYLTHERYARCPGCGRVYWEGTHGRRMREQLARLSPRARGPRPHS
jgi:hypothetical protein